ncbi:Hypothetical protein SAI4T8_1016920 [Staphylococcus aureus subsp. aureus ST228]|uniref:Uncharacterized protein n=1 Tax=Staphylococcus aureus subsp. aureus ST228 TaxID=1074919 RepID=A0A7U7EZL1_STAAU|nr:Hypothetical protein SAI1T1_2016910 [Staphylococcus aureus subsp. aureus ST228]CCJ13566.1 Hypothetical protein SAI2T2_1016920 [Staphylococcus aureus subsp. aureus ST228]CCJ15530.1 Hypothetical protein SAI3T3_1016910 [Staphylococcus aureus subsp. aureus ST228]CCJ19458.1 Hypothetical protein SAI5S5_1016850 [Staphylococcus aureus subsp. aureus ST228]CCJ21422.1 Hypothetical protein SAI6T6_1016860 [Staphylococcus aureus subsp. aureus ST228]
MLKKSKAILPICQIQKNKSTSKKYTLKIQILLNVFKESLQTMALK